ncbi:hypothetical protein BJV78DRAFT_1283729 [Lactifluus subvellereus]|nr:hypothetical protein BJV78DRAFT_1283729 [Lactifluus subvellereus]
MASDQHTKWQSIRPWHPRLSLSVIEITSVSATFVISSLSESNQQLAIPDPLSKGVSVKVNGTPWPKCLARLADDADEAMIIIYGLMPGRQYDIELGVIPGDDKFKGQIVTESVAGNRARSDSDSSSGIPQVGAFPPNTSNSPAVDRSPSPPSPSPPQTPSGPSYTSQTFEDRLASLQLELSQLQAENETLSNTLKSARRDSQKAQAAQRAEISSLKRAAQKHSAGDTRMKQKARALEEAVKQAVKGREDVEAEYAVVEAARVEQEAELADASRRFERARARAEEWRARREKAEEEASGKLQGAKAELAAVEARLEKLRTKREKLEGRAAAAAAAEEGGLGGEGKEQQQQQQDGSDAPGGLVGELEAKLRELLLERERIEADPYGHVQQPFPPSPSEETTAATDARAQGSSPPNHPRGPHHSHSHSMRSGSGSSSNSSKRPAAPAFSSHSHSRATTIPSSSSSASPAAARTVAPTLPRNHSTRGASTGTSSGGKGSVAWRKSSPPSPPPHAQAEKSALSLNAPPFEPASIKGKNNPRGSLTRMSEGA